MGWKKEMIKLTVIVAVFLVCYFLPLEMFDFGGPVMEALYLVKWYAREHVLLCLIPAFFIAGAIAVFVSQNSVMKYLGAGAKKIVAYSVASVSGAILAVCSCTVLPLFAGIYRLGAGIGPATAFLYAGPAINVLAIILTARVLGMELGIARAIGAVAFSVVIGLLMHLVFRKEEKEKAAAVTMPDEHPPRALWQTSLFFFSMVAILVFANWARSGDIRAAILCCPNGLRVTHAVEGTISDSDDQKVHIVDDDGKEHVIARNEIRSIRESSNSVPGWISVYRWSLVGLAGCGLWVMIWRWFRRSELKEWVSSSWGLGAQMLPLLFVGVIVAGLLLGAPEMEGREPGEGLIPHDWVHWAVGGNSFMANFFASVAGAFMYFATLTEVPILRGLMDSGMGKGPALALLLAGPALSLPNMLVIRSVMGTKKTVVYVVLVIVMATASGLVFGTLF